MFKNLVMGIKQKRRIKILGLGKQKLFSLLLASNLNGYICLIYILKCFLYIVNFQAIIIELTCSSFCFLCH